MKRSSVASFLCVTSSTIYASSSLETHESKFASTLWCFRSAPVVKAHESGEDEPGTRRAHHCPHEEQERVRYAYLVCLSSISRPRI
jgi:hypothetical protein